MKRFLLLLANICILAVSCQTDTTTDNTIDKGGDTTLSVSLANTRTSLGEKVGSNYLVYWSEGDRIVVNGTLSEEVDIDAQNRSNAIFSVTPSFGYPAYITYPYCTSTSAEQPIVEFPAEQNFTEGSFALGSTPMCGYSEGKGASIALSHLAALLRIPVKAKYEGTILDRIVITSTSGAKLAGEFKVDCKNATITPTDETQSSITYHLPDNYTLSTTEESLFYISLAAVDVGSCTIEFVDSSNEKMMGGWTPNKVLAQGVVREFKPVIFEPKTYTTLQGMEIEEDVFTIFYKRVYGHIRYSDGSPIKGVAVSDGFQVVTTDSNGYYELNNVTSETWYIYCSLPNDVEIPIDDLGRPAYFQKYPATSPEHNFTFKKLAGGAEKEFMLFALADTQPTGSDHLERFRTQAAPEIKSYSKSLNKPCYGVVLGDLVGSVPEIMNDMRSELECDKVGMPLFPVMGNHDHIRYNANSPVFPDERNSSFFIKIQRDFEECFGPVNFSFNRGDVHIVGMRNVKHKDNILTSNYSTGFTTEQFEWLKQDLALVPKNKMVVLCVHIPMYNTGTLGDGSYRQEVLNMLDQYAEAHILSGHTHYMRPYDHVWNNTGHKIFEHCIASTRYDMKECNIHRDGTPCGYGVLEANGNSFVDWYYKGFPYGMNSRDDQIRLYRGGSIFGAEPTGEDKYGTKGFYQLPFDNGTLLANIFSSDPSWRVEVYEDGSSTPTGTMTHFTATSDSEFDKLIGDGTLANPRRVADGVVCSRDFWAISLLYGYCGSSVGNNYNNCYTMWRYTLKNPNATNIEVRATDRFGMTYTASRIENNSDLGYAMYDPAKNPTIE